MISKEWVSKEMQSNKRLRLKQANKKLSLTKHGIAQTDRVGWGGVDSGRVVNANMVYNLVSLNLDRTWTAIFNLTRMSLCFSFHPWVCYKLSIWADMHLFQLANLIKCPVTKHKSSTAFYSFAYGDVARQSRSENFKWPRVNDGNEGSQVGETRG